MPVIYFVIDTCASMNQVISDGITFIDVAKTSIESVIKLRLRENSTSGKVRERFMIVFYDNKTASVYRSGLKDNFEKMMSKLKLIECFGSSKLAQAIRDTFEIINVNRVASGIETFTFGRKPFYLEPCTIILLTHARNRFLDPSAGQLEFNISPSFEGSELYFEPFRWDEKIFTICLLSGSVASFNTSASLLEACAQSLVDKLCSATGGYITFASSLSKSVSEILGILEVSSRPSLLINFICQSESILNKSNLLSHSSKTEFLSGNSNKNHSNEDNFINASSNLASQQENLFLSFINVPLGQVGSSIMWPIPESYHLDASITTLPPRRSIPSVYFNIKNQTDYSIGLLNYDSYLVDNKAFCDFLLNVSTSDARFECYSTELNRKNSPPSRSFGFLSTNHDQCAVYFNILVYDYHILSNLLDELVKVLKLQATNDWKCAFDIYLNSIPYYYIKCIKIQLQKLNISNNFVGDIVNSSINQSIVNHINKIMSQAKTRMETITDQSIRAPAPGLIEPSPIIFPEFQSGKSDVRKVLLSQKINTLVTRRSFSQFLKDIVASSDLNKTFISYDHAKPFHNPFDVELSDIINHIPLMKLNLEKYGTNSSNRVMDRDVKHCVAISVMGDYQSRVKEIDPEKLIDPSSVKSTTFGSPFKARQPKEFSANEADIQLFTHMENSRSAFYKMRMERRRRAYRIFSQDSISSTFSEEEEVDSEFSFTDDSQQLFFDDLTTSQSWHMLHQLPYRNYLTDCYHELRNHNPSLKIIKKYTSELKNILPLFQIFLTSIKNEAIHFNNQKFIRYINRELNKINPVPLP